MHGARAIYERDPERPGRDADPVHTVFLDRQTAAFPVGVPPGLLGVSFVDGTCTVHVVKPTSPLLGATKKGETLLSVNGKPVTPTTIFDVIKAADDGTSERMLVFRRASSSKLSLAAGETKNGPRALAPIVSKESPV